ncbi:sensor histidine kinase [Hymenobacter nivis]|nr:histidine kinase [Hymenobacter nivis]
MSMPTVPFAARLPRLPRLPKFGAGPARHAVLFPRRTYLLITLGISIAFGLLILPASILQRPHTTAAEALLLFINPVLVFQVQFEFNYLLRYRRHPVQRWLGRQPARPAYLFRLAFTAVVVSLYNAGRYYLDTRLHLRLDNNPLDAVLAWSQVATVVGFSFQLALELVENSRYLTIENEMLKREQLQARYESLKQQLSPHFLFNSLSTLGELIYDEPDAAALFVEEMAHVYRYLLRHGEQAAVPLRDELHFLRSYVYLLRMRFSTGIQLEIDLPDDIQDRPVPPLALQLLLENAVKHNAVSHRQPLVVRIDFVAPATLRVRNNRYPRLTPTPETSSGVGLSNLTNRVRLLHQQHLLVEQTPDEFCVYLPLPA